MKVCHISDWHGNMKPLPRADLYVVTGDMLPNFPLIKVMVDVRRGVTVTHDPYDPRGGQPPAGAYVGRVLDRKREAAKQAGWCAQHPFRREFAVDEDAPVLIVKGNHDFIPLSDWVGGDVWEADDDPTRTTNTMGLKVGGCRGINYIVGEWADELRREQFDERARGLPQDLDVLLTHAPPLGILDFEHEYYGSSAITSYINRRTYGESGNLKAHFFGHVHGASGTRVIGSALFSNAACTTNLVDL